MGGASMEQGEDAWGLAVQRRAQAQQHIAVNKTLSGNFTAILVAGPLGTERRRREGKYFVVMERRPLLPHVFL